MRKRSKINWVIVGVCFLCLFASFLVILYYDTYKTILTARTLLVLSGICVLVTQLCINIKLILLLIKKSVFKRFLFGLLIVLSNIFILTLPLMIYHHEVMTFATLQAVQKRMTNKQCIVELCNDNIYLEVECTLEQYEKIQTNKNYYGITLIKSENLGKIYLKTIKWDRE